MSEILRRHREADGPLATHCGHWRIVHDALMMRFWRRKSSETRPAEEKPSERLLEQRVRNRIMEEIWGLSRGDLNVAQAGGIEWFESFFDFYPYDGEPDLFPAMTPEEASAVREVCNLMQQAIADPAIPKRPSIEDITRTGWPERIAPVAKRALDLMLQRGRFSEEEEEEVPSGPIDLWQS